jgi:hypothetical protein
VTRLPSDSPPDALGEFKVRVSSRPAHGPCPSHAIRITLVQHAVTNTGGLTQSEENVVTGGTRLSGPHWRRVVAALANDDARTAYAQIVLGAKLLDVVADLNDKRRNRAISVLLGSGLVERNAANELEPSEAIFRELLTQQPRRQAQAGLARFMRLGRIERYPANMAERRELLAWIVRETIEPGEHLTEKQVNERLLSYTDDVVMLRRYMIDFRQAPPTPGRKKDRHPGHGFLVATPVLGVADGLATSYWRHPCRREHGKGGLPCCRPGKPTEKMGREEEVGAAIGGLVHNARKIRPETGAS